MWTLKRRITTMLTCCYCDHYRNTRMKRGENKEGNIRTCPTCPNKIKKITADNEVCKEFIPADYFFCEKFDQQMTARMCEKRIKNEINLDQWKYCKKCRQFKKTIHLILDDKPKSKFSRRK